jgi:hypothetical protein
VGSVDLQEVEPGLVSAKRGGHELFLDDVHAGAIEFKRCLVAGAVGQRGRANGLPVAGLQRLVNAFPHQPCGALAPGMAELGADFRRGMGVDKVND